MGRSELLRHRDIRFAYQILGEVTELGTNPHVWRQHALNRVCSRIGGRVGLSLELNNLLPDALPVAIDPVDVGFDGPSERSLYVRYMQSNQRAVDPSNVALCAVQPNRRFLTVRRHEIIDDSAWYASPVTSESRRGSNVDHYLCSLYRLPCPGSTTGFIFYRNWNESEFDVRAKKFLRLFHVLLLKRLFGSASGDHATLANLPRHLRQLLRSILDGSSAKEAADRLGLSPHTIKSYSKALYDRLGVHSRGELMKRFLGSQQLKPILMPEGLNL